MNLMRAIYESVVTIIVLVGIVGMVRKAAPPRKLAVPYIKGEEPKFHYCETNMCLWI